MPFTASRPRIHYLLRGDPAAPPLVMLRGLGRTARHWDGVVETLEPHFRLLLVDNRGVGHSEPVRRPFGVADMARDVVHALDAAGIDRAHVFGMSLGGMIAQRMAIDQRSRVDKLVLGCTTAGGRHAERVGITTWLRLATAGAGGVEAAIAAQARYVLSQPFRRDNPQVIDRWLQIAREQPVSPLSLVLQAAAALGHDSYDELPRITAPTLIISSDEDLLIPPSNSRLLARRIKGAEIAWLPRSAHDFATERPGELSQILQSFLL